MIVVAFFEEFGPGARVRRSTRVAAAVDMMNETRLETVIVGSQNPVR